MPCTSISLRLRRGISPLCLEEGQPSSERCGLGIEQAEISFKILTNALVLANLSESSKLGISLPPGFRFLHARDVVKPFVSGDPRMDKYTLREYHVWSELSNELVIVYTPEGEEVAGVIEIIVEKDFMIVEKVAKNLLVEASGVGPKLMSLAEGIARVLGRKEIRLEALDTTVEWYDDKLGYVEYATVEFDEEWGELTPKRKTIEPMRE
jgi:hypothetical protein